MKKKDDLYIAVLKFGKKNIGKPFFFKDLEFYLQEKGYKYDEFALRQFFTSLFISLESPGGNNQGNPVNSEHTFFLENQGYFHLLEHEELKSARNSSLLATCFVLFAILISIVSTSFSIHYSKKQLTEPTTIQEKQFNQLRSSNKDTLIYEIRKTQNHKEINEFKNLMDENFDELIEQLKNNEKHKS